MKKRGRVLGMLLVPALVVVAVLFFAGRSILTSSFDYNKINEASRLNIYYKGELFASIENPSSIFGDMVAIYVTNPSQLGLSPFRMEKLYVLEYMTDNKTICRITVLTPSDAKAIATLENKHKLNEWDRLGGECVVMKNRLCYFSLGKGYYTQLSEMINTNIFDEVS